MPGRTTCHLTRVSRFWQTVMVTFSFPDTDRYVFGSHNFHEVTMSYPMRYIRSKRYKLIHNLNYPSAFPIDQDFYLSPTFQDLLQRTFHNQSLHWYKRSLREYYQRPEFELFDLKSDPEEKYNVAHKGSYKVRISSTTRVSCRGATTYTYFKMHFSSSWLASKR